MSLLISFFFLAHFSSGILAPVLACRISLFLGVCTLLKPSLFAVPLWWVGRCPWSYSWKVSLWKKLDKLFYIIFILLYLEKGSDPCKFSRPYFHNVFNHSVIFHATLCMEIAHPDFSGISWRKTHSCDVRGFGR